MAKAKVAKKSTSSARVSKGNVKAKSAKPAKASAAPKVAVPAKSKKAAPAKPQPVTAAKQAAAAKPAELEKAPVAAAAPQIKLSQRVPATKLSVKVAAKMEAKAKKPARKTRAQKLEELGIDKTNQLSQKWSSLFRKTQDVQAKPYNMRHQFEAKTPIMHKLLGWGYILTNKNDRLEVLFKDGIRYLISNYKA